MKKAGLLLLILLVGGIFSFILVNVQAQETPPLPSEVEKIQNISEKGKETLEKLSDKEKREYAEWKKILLENKFVAFIDPILTKISFIFVVILGEPYALSGIFFIMLILWFYFFFKISEIFLDYSPFSEVVSWIIGFGLVVVMAQTKILRKIAEFFVWFVFYKEATWWRFLIFIGIIVGLIVLYSLSSQFGKAFKEQKEKIEIEKQKAELKAGAKVAKGFTKGLSGK